MNPDDHEGLLYIRLWDILDHVGSFCSHPLPPLSLMPSKFMNGLWFIYLTGCLNRNQACMAYFTEAAEAELTQLLATLASITANDGNLESNWCTDGNLQASFLESVFPARIRWSSAWLMRGLSRGSFVIPNAHKDSQKNPRDAKKAKEPFTPILENIIGEARKLITFPRWKPAMEIPTAVARSWRGNHLHHAREKNDSIKRSISGNFFVHHSCTAAPDWSSN